VAAEGIGMKRVIVALIIGAAMGYHWGYDEGSDGKPSIVARTLDRFGTSKIKAAQEEHERRIQEVTK
jgi:hypothetical protein